MRNGRSSADPVAFDEKSGSLAKDGNERRLEPKAAQVLVILASADGGIVSRASLLDGAWGSASGSDEALTQAVAQIRRLFQELGEDDPIETLAKRGYRLRARLASDSSPAVAQTERRSIGIWLVILAAILAYSYFQPHGLRHFVRHTLGLGPPQHVQ
jgi:DNA-binding winged helix-turn-helix (wHTH) protein